MKKIFKYPLAAELQIPLVDSGILAVDFDPKGTLSMWCEIDEDLKPRTIKIDMIGTGSIVPENRIYIRTIRLGEFMFHIYIDEVMSDEN